MLNPSRLFAAALLVVGLAGTGPLAAKTQQQGEGGGARQCSAQEAAVIDQAFNEASRRVRSAIAYYDADPESAHVVRWFGDGGMKEVRFNLVLIAQALQPGRRPRVFCDTSAGCQAFASANSQARTMVVCNRFFRSPSSGQDSRFGVIVHEVSHIAAGTQDVAYQPRGAQLLARQDPESAAMNADNYEYFVEFLPAGGAGSVASRNAI